MDIKLKNIRKDKTLFSQVSICLLMFLSVLIMINSFADIISNHSYEVVNSNGYLNSSEYASQLDNLHANLNNSIYYQYYQVYVDTSVKDKNAEIKKLSPTLRSSIKLNTIENYGAEVLYFIVDNNNGEIYTNTTLASLKTFESNYKKKGYTFINTTNNATDVYINNVQKYISVSYNLSNNFDMNNADNYFLRDVVKPPTVYVAISHDFSEDGYFGSSLNDYRKNAYMNISNFIFFLILSIVLFKVIKDKFGLKETFEVLGKLFNDTFIEIRILILLFVLMNINAFEFKIVLIIFAILTLCAVKYDYTNIISCSLYKYITSSYKTTRVRANFSKKVRSRIIGSITRCVISGGLSFIILILLIAGMGYYSDLMTGFFFACLIYLLYSIVKLYVYSIKSVRDIDEVYYYIKSLGDGSLYSDIHLNDESYYKEIEYNLNSLKEHIKNTVEEQVKSEKMKSELVTNVSHDLKTPLTSIINYVDLMKREDIKPDKAKEYLEILDNKSQKLKKLVEDIFEISKASSGNIKLNNSDINLKSIINQSIGEFSDKIEENGLTVKVDFEDDFVVNADGEKLGRILENLIQNAVKYSLTGSRIYIDLKREEDKPSIIISNISNYEMNFTSEEILTRFARADKARDLEGFGLGLSIVQSFTDLMNIDFSISIDKDLFKAKLVFNDENMKKTV